MKNCQILSKEVSTLLIFCLVSTISETLMAQPGFPVNNKPPIPIPAHKNISVSPSDTLSQVGQWSWGQSLAVTVRDNYAFIGNGSLLQILDISNPVATVNVGQVDVGSEIFQMVVSGNYVYLTPAFSIIDITDLTNPHLISAISSSYLGFTGAIAIWGNYAFVGNILGEIFTIDVSDRTQPEIVGGQSNMLTQGFFVGSIAVYDTVLYASTTDGTSADIFDISNPASPVHLSTSFGYRGVMAIQGHYLYYADQGVDNELWVYDISQPFLPRYISGTNLSSLSGYLAIKDSLVFACEASAGFDVIDVADTSNIHVLAHVPFRYSFPPPLDIGPVSAGVGSTSACLASNNGIWLVDMTKLPAFPTDYYLVTGWASTYDIATDTSNHAFLAEEYGGLNILDFSTPSSPALRGQYIPNEAVRAVAVNRNSAYVLCDSDLVVLDISDISSPKPIGEVVFGDTINDNNGFGELGCLAIYDSTAYVGRNSGKLYAIDVSNSACPQIKDITPTIGIPTAISMSGNYLYVGNANTGIQVFNVSVPGRLYESGSIMISGMGGLSASGKNLFTLSDSGFSKYNIVDSLSIEWIGSCKLGYDYTSQIKIVNNFAYTSYRNYFVTIDIGNAAAPTVFYSFYGPYGFSSFGISGNLALLGRVHNSLLLLADNYLTAVRAKTELRENFELSQNYPNPFNPSTRISYKIPYTGEVLLSVFDVAGREVMRLVEGVQAAGIHQIEFNPKNLSSGAYFYRLLLGGRSTVKKMELIK